MVPPDYFADRYLGRAPVDASVRFVDLDHPETHAAAITPLRGLLRAHRLRTVDRGVLFHQDRRVTRPIARHFWALAQTADHRHWAGLRYASRLSGDWECWAIWEPSPIRSHATEIRAVTRSDPALVRAAALLGISL